MHTKSIHPNPATQPGERRPASLPVGRRRPSVAICSWLSSIFFLASLVVGSSQGFAAQHTPPHPAQTAPPPKPQSQRVPPASGVQHQPGPKQNQHLGEWLSTHQNQPLAEQERALQLEPGFSRLPPEQQQRLTNRLRELNNKTPEQRQRTIDRVEVWERLSPEEKRQVSNSTMQLRMLPPDRQMPLRKAFRDLRDVPPEQRQSILNSPRFQSQFTPEERGILGNLLTVEPYQPNRPPSPATSPALPMPTPAYR
jgi:hypothetical protein